VFKGEASHEYYIAFDLLSVDGND